MRKSEILERCINAASVVEDYKIVLGNIYEKIKRSRTESDEEQLEEDINVYFDTYDEVYEYVNNQLGTINFFEDTISQMKKLIKRREYETIFDMIDEFSDLLQKIHCAIALIDTMSGNCKEALGLEIKLPDLNDITELKKYIDGLEFIFTKCPFFQNNDANLKLETVDSGSIWFGFGVVCASLAVGSVFLNNITAFIDKCYVIKSHSLTCTRQKQEIENAKIEQREKEELLKNIDRLYRISVENAIRELQATTGCPIQDGEEMGRAEQSFEKMIKLLDQGLQIYASIDSPQEVKALFEPLKMYYLSTEKELKKIEKKSETDSE